MLLNTYRINLNSKDYMSGSPVNGIWQINLPKNLDSSKYQFYVESFNIVRSGTYVNDIINLSLINNAQANSYNSSTGLNTVIYSGINTDNKNTVSINTIGFPLNQVLSSGSLAIQLSSAIDGVIQPVNYYTIGGGAFGFCWSLSLVIYPIQEELLLK